MTVPSGVATGMFTPLPELAQYQFDSNGIPMKNFGGELGWQYEPIVPVYFAQRYIEHYRQTGKPEYQEGLDRMVAWLRRQIVPFGNANRAERTIYSHYDYLPYVKAPWICGMNCGRVAELYLQLYEDSSCEEHLDTATALILGLLVPARDGGILLDTSDGGYVFEEFGRLAPALWSLNGHCSVLKSFYRYLRVVDDSKVRQALECGIDAVEHVLELFDTDNPEIGSKVKLFGFGTLRLRSVARGHGPDGPLVHAVTLCFPNDPPLRIPLTEVDGGSFAGWELYCEKNSRLEAAIKKDKTLGRPFARLSYRDDQRDSERYYAQAVLRVGLTDNCAPDDLIVVELDHYAMPGKPLAVDIFPGQDQSYIQLGQTCSDVRGWKTERFKVRFGELGGPFGNFVAPDHGYHAMNTEYIEFLNEVRPSSLLSRIARKWRNKLPGNADQPSS